MEIIAKVRELFRDVRKNKRDNEQIRLLIGSMLSKNIDLNKSYRDAEFKIFSQFGDDGIIQFLIKKLNISVEKFVEFGVEDYRESNTRFLLMHNDWQGLVIDGSKSQVELIKNDPMYWRHDLTAVHSFINAENINQILLDNNFKGKVGILSIDIDGNDYWVWQAITVVDADIVIVEYNGIFGSERAITVPYKPDFDRVSAHYSGLYFGASLQALCELGSKKGYAFIGSNRAGNNAYFLKKEIVGGLDIVSPEAGFVKSKFREARNSSGELTFFNEEARKKEIANLPVINVINNSYETV